MKNTIFLFNTIITLISCDTSFDSQLLHSGKYHGEFKAVYPVGCITIDTINLSIEKDIYQYSSSSSLNSGAGYLIEENDSIEFFDEVARNAMLTWDWILGGKYSYSNKDDTIFLEKVMSGVQYSYKLFME